MSGATLFWFGRQVEAADDVARPLGDDADDELGRVVDA